MSIATGFQGDGTPHGHGFVALRNMFQYHDLAQLSDMIDNNIHTLDSQAMLDRVTSSIDHVQCEDHINDAMRTAPFAEISLAEDVC